MLYYSTFAICILEAQGSQLRRAPVMCSRAWWIVLCGEPTPQPCELALYSPAVECTPELLKGVSAAELARLQAAGRHAYSEHFSTLERQFGTVLAILSGRHELAAGRARRHQLCDELARGAAGSGRYGQGTRALCLCHTRRR